MEPKADRPYMPGYGVVGPDEGMGLLPWSWAVERLVASHDYWLATVRPDGRAHVTPVWGIWHEDAVWFCCSGQSRKARNLGADPRCVVTTNNALEPVIVEGQAERRLADADVEGFTQGVHRKYQRQDYDGFIAGNALYRVRPALVFGLTRDDPRGSPTRWLPGE